MPTDPIQPFLFRHPVSAGTHLLFCAWAIYATALLRRLCASDRLRRASVTVFGASVVLLYASSGLYHAIPAGHPDLIHLFLRLDLASIHLLIAGTCTPVFAILLRGLMRLLLLVLNWALAEAAVALFLPRLSSSPPLALYVVQAACAFIPAVVLARSVGSRGMALLIGGTLVYLFGTICDLRRWPVLVPGAIGPHEVLHVCDMIGTSCPLGFTLLVLFTTVRENPRAAGPDNLVRNL
jgi:hemolysin III